MKYNILSQLSQHKVFTMYDSVPRPEYVYFSTLAADNLAIQGVKVSGIIPLT